MSNIYAVICSRIPNTKAGSFTFRLCHVYQANNKIPNRITTDIFRELHVEYMLLFQTIVPTILIFIIQNYTIMGK